jgi:FkbM family methyltransferase
VKALIHRALRRLGYDIHRYNPSVFPDARREPVYRHGINLVSTWAPNAGQFGRLRQMGYRAASSFEPLQEARRQLLAASSGDASWEIADRTALGERDGEIDIHVSANSVSSSVLDMLDAHLRNAPESRYIASERVPLRRLDAVSGPYLKPESVTLLKIDAQGYEDRVLDGAAGILPRVAGIHLELSVVPLYAGQALFPEMLDRLRGLGFELCAWPAFVEPDGARLLQVDSTIFRLA